MKIPSSFSAMKKKNQLEDKTPAGGVKGIASRFKLDSLARHYGWILTLMGIVIIIDQTREHLADFTSDRQSYVAYYMEIFGVILFLGLIGLLIRVLIATIAEKTRALNILQVKHDFSQQLSASQDIPALSKSLVQQIAGIAPSVNIELYIHELARDWFIRVIHQGDESAANKKENFSPSMASYPCRECILDNVHTLRPLDACNRQDVWSNPDEIQPGFCMPLVYGTSPVGLLLLYSSSGQQLDMQQAEVLGYLTDEVSQAIGMLIEKKAREEALLTERLHTAQLDIARDLHDTVGQNISYLRMKLDHLSETNDKTQSDLIMEIRSMSKVANESYDLVRGTLAVLQADNSADLLYLFSRYAEQVAERSSFNIDFSTQGEARSLSASRMRHLFYIFREALSNIEKHAFASQAHVQIVWEENNLKLSISDNGRGYDLSSTQKVDIHYGLKFMRERATLLTGSLSIQSIIGTGTNISILIPRE